MEKPDSDTTQSGQGPDDDLFSLALDCTEMVTELSQGFELERQGDHESAMATLDTVKRQIDGWLEKLKELNAEEVDKKELVQGLEEAKEAISFDSGE